MALPRVPLPTTKLEIGGELLEVRGLSRSEAISVGEMANKPNEAEIWVVAKGCDVDISEAREWREVMPSAVIDQVVNKILELSGLQGAATFPDDSESPASG